MEYIIVVIVILGLFILKFTSGKWSKTKGNTRYPDEGEISREKSGRLILKNNLGNNPLEDSDKCIVLIKVIAVIIAFINIIRWFNAVGAARELANLTNSDMPWGELIEMLVQNVILLPLLLFIIAEALRGLFIIANALSKMAKEKK